MPVPTFIRRKDGLVTLNELKRHVRTQWLLPQRTGNRRANQVVAANMDSYFRFATDQFGPFEGYGLSYDRTHPDVLVSINDDSARRSLMNRPILADNIMSPLAGGTDLFVLPETMWLEATRVYTMVFTDFSGAANTVRPVIHGRKFFLRQARPGTANKIIRRKRISNQISSPYFYTTDINVVLGANARGVPFDITITDEGHFEWWLTTMRSDGPIDWRITDAESGTPFSGPEYINGIQNAGLAIDPYFMPEPTFIEKNTGLHLEFDDYGGVAGNRVFVTLIGRRIYDEEYTEAR